MMGEQRKHYTAIYSPGACLHNTQPTGDVQHQFNLDDAAPTWSCSPGCCVLPQSRGHAVHSKTNHHGRSPAHTVTQVMIFSVCVWGGGGFL